MDKLTKDEAVIQIWRGTQSFGTKKITNSYSTCADLVLAKYET